MTATVTRSSSLQLRTQQDIVRARQAVRKMAQELSFSLVDQTKLVTAASELARNTVTHGGGGSVQCDVLTDGARKGIRLCFVDQGPGIPNVAQAMTDGWTTGSGLGLGLAGSKRLSHDFHIVSEPGVGTSVTVTRWKQ